MPTDGNDFGQDQTPALSARSLSTVQQYHTLSPISPQSPRSPALSGPARRPPSLPCSIGALPLSAGGLDLLDNSRITAANQIRAILPLPAPDTHICYGIEGWKEPPSSHEHGSPSPSAGGREKQQVPQSNNLNFCKYSILQRSFILYTLHYSLVINQVSHNDFITIMNTQ